MNIRSALLFPHRLSHTKVVTLLCLVFTSFTAGAQEGNFTFQLPSPDTPITAAPERSRLDIGEPVELVRVEFDYKGDLEGKRMNCGPYRFSDEEYIIDGPTGVGLRTYYEFLPYDGGATVTYNQAYDDSALWLVQVDVEDFRLPLHWALYSSFIEVFKGGYYQHSTDGSVWGCKFLGTNEHFIANSVLLTPQVSCDYSSSEQYEGWGWNPALLQSCPPLELTPTNNCDYSHASSFGGWGWDPVARMSCEPIETMVSASSQCDYSNADLHGGWGWNTVTGESCEPLDVSNTVCIDTDGDGWGWDGTASCIP